MQTIAFLSLAAVKLLGPVAAAIPAVCVALAWLVLAELPQPATAAASKATVVVASAGRCQ